MDKYKNYEIGLLNASIVYCNPNVVNRYLRFTYKTVNYNMVMPNGIYSLNDLNVMFVISTESLFANGLFYCEGLDSTAQVALFCNDYENTQVSFISNNDNILIFWDLFRRSINLCHNQLSIIIYHKEELY